MQWSPSRRRKTAAMAVTATVGWAAWAVWICKQRAALLHISSPPIGGRGERQGGKPRFPSLQTSLPWLSTDNLGKAKPRFGGVFLFRHCPRTIAWGLSRHSRHAQAGAIGNPFSAQLAEALS